jgi:hypothetical protein
MTLAGGRFSATRFLSRVGLDRVPMWALTGQLDCILLFGYEHVAVLKWAGMTQSV